MLQQLPTTAQQYSMQGMHIQWQPNKLGWNLSMNYIACDD